MDANNQTQGGRELAEHIRAVRGEPAHRFEVYDHDSEVTHRFPTAESAKAKAEEMGATRFRHLGADGMTKQVDKVDGEWYVRNQPTPPRNSQQPPSADDKPLASVQAEIDRDALRAIEIRAEQRAAAGQGLDAETDRKMAAADAHAFRRIEDKSLQESAAVEMANNAREYPEYKAGLDKAIPGYPGTAAKVYALDAAMKDKQRERTADRDALDGAAPEVSKEQAAVPDPAEAQQGKAFFKVMEYQGPEDYDGIEHRFEKLDDAIVKAEALGKTNIDAYDETGKWHPVRRGNDGEWRHGKSLAEQGYFGPFRELNTVEPDIEKERQPLSEAQDAQRAAWLKKAEADTPKPQAGKPPSGNKVESDEIFTATQSETKLVVPPDVEKQYLHVGNKFYHPKNTDLVAFEDKGNRLETKSNSEAIAESMVRISEARGWDEIKVSGSETFRREVWLEAASRGMHVKGYSPSEQDKAELAKRLSQTEANKMVEKGSAPFRARENDGTKDVKAQPEQPKPDTPEKRMAESFAKDSPEEAVKKHPELAGAVAAVASMEKKAEADGLNAQQRAIVMARVRQNVVNSIERGHIPEVKVKEEMEVKRERRAEKEYAR